MPSLSSPLPAPFRSPDEFRQAFVDGLEQMLQHEGLGVFILVLANATFDRTLYPHLHDRLAERFDLLAARLSAAEAAGEPLPDAADDQAVFRQLLATGFDRLQLTRFRHAGPWQLQYNQLRAFRPPRMSQAVVTELCKPFDDQSFHFNKPFLNKEVLWQGELLGRDCRLLYNKFPFAMLHGLLVVDPMLKKPQFLAEADHAHVWQLTQTLGERLPGWGLGYNANGANASVNHQHFQSFLDEGDGLPIESARWRHNGGAEAFPLDCRVFDEAAAAWSFIDTLHHANTPYNLLYRPGRLYITPRAFQGSRKHADWAGGFAWAELAGACTLHQAQDYQTLTARDVSEALSTLSVIDSPDFS